MRRIVGSFELVTQRSRIRQDRRQGDEYPHIHRLFILSRSSIGREKSIAFFRWTEGSNSTLRPARAATATLPEERLRVRAAAFFTAKDPIPGMQTDFPCCMHVVITCTRARMVSFVSCTGRPLAMATRSFSSVSFMVVVVSCRDLSFSSRRTMPYGDRRRSGPETPPARYKS